jgi:hypothetical protein
VKTGWLALAFSMAGVRAEASVRTLFPPSDQVFHRLLADPRQPQSLVRYYRQGGSDLADVALGNTWGILRWEPSEGLPGWVFQWSVEGMGYSRFVLNSGINEFQTIDFFANIPLEFRKDAFSGRVMLFHQSSHLGDDYIRRTNDKGFRYGVDGFRATLSYELHPQARVYGGGTALVHGVPSDQEGGAQSGFELRTPDLRWIKDHECWGYFGQDFQWLGRTGWNLSSRTEAGLRIGVPRVVRAMRAHVAYTGGHSSFGQFYKREEFYWDFGLSFDF